MNAENTVHRQNSWIWALVWCGPIKRPGFLSRRMYGFILGWLISSGVVHLCSVFGASAFGSCVAVNERAPLFIPSTDLSHFISVQPLFFKVNELQRLTYPVCSARDFCIESEDFGANILEIKS